jgi:hypothetical protein
MKKDIKFKKTLVLDQSEDHFMDKPETSEV